MAMTTEWSIPCLVCGRRLRAQEVHTCESCNAVCYCSSSCKELNFMSEVNPDHGHLLWCAKMKAFMSVESRLCELPLAFARVTTSSSFSDHQLAQFLTAHGIFNMGLWKYEHPLGTRNMLNSVNPSGRELHLFSSLWTISKLGAPHHDPCCNFWSKLSNCVSSEDAMLRAYILPTESILLSLRPTVPQTMEPSHHLNLATVSLSNWAEYYIWRGFASLSTSQSPQGDYSEFCSPIAILMHWPMTIYYVLTHILPKTYPQVIQVILEKGVLIIHVIGVDLELSILPIFLELAYLLKPDLTVRLFFIGTNFDSTVDHHVFHLSSRLSVAVYAGTYHEFVRDHLSQFDRPHLIIGFNSGLSAYETWSPTLKVIHALNVPAYFTDACLYSCAWGYRVVHCLGLGTDEYTPECGRVLDDSDGTGVRAPILNPFRSPIRMQSAGARWGWFRNAFIYAPIQPTLHPSDQYENENDILSKLNSLQL